MVRLPQPFLAEIDQPDALEPACQPVHGAKAAGERRVLPDVRIGEDLPARPHHAPDFAEHLVEGLARQVLEHVERIALEEGAVGKREAAQVAQHQVAALDGLRGEIRRDVDADHGRAASAVPHERSSAAASEIDDEIAGRGTQEPP